MVKTRSTGNVSAVGTPTYIRSVDSALSAEDRQYLRLKLGQKLHKFAPAVVRSSVRVEDVNGPRGGIDKRCRIKVVLRGLPSVVVEELHQSQRDAIDGALPRMER
ncbi:MAG TPA: HPF/RaiA family ribosome-associated protein, partial [Woeseiaceae bacterium]|nr:HPF/RaiA family ribosome-associated protein [Woeseiaceae bacterium]